MRPSKPLRLLAVSLSLAAPAAVAAPVDVPMRAYGVYPAVEVRVNGRGPYLFLIDTGASGQGRIDRSLVAPLGLAIGGTTTGSSASTGRSVQVERVRVQSLEFGGRRYEAVDALVGSYNAPGEYLRDIGGVLAFNLFAGELLTLDYCHRRVRVAKGELPPPDGREIVAYEERGGIPYVEGRIGSERAMMVLDSGSDRALDLPTETVRRLFLADFPRPLGRAAGLGGETGGLGIVTLEDPLRVGGQSFERVEATFAAAWQRPVIGSALLRDRVLTFDQKNKRLRIERPAACHGAGRVSSPRTSAR